MREKNAQQELENKKEEREFKKQLLQSKINNQPKKLSEAQKVVDRKFGADYDLWSSGGSARAATEIGRLENVLKDIKKGKISLGRENALIPEILTSNNRKAARSIVESSVVESLRPILGAQFTEKEGDRIIKTTWNEDDSNENNAERLETLIKNLKTDYNNKLKKAQYYEEFGSLEGYKSSPSSVAKQFNISEIDGDSPSTKENSVSSNSDMVTVLDPNGKPKIIPKSKLSAALNAGGRLP